MSLYAAITAAGIPTDNHASDLYFPVTDQSRAILERFPLQKGNATTFRNQRPPNVGELWFDVPFAFLPYWEQRMKERAGLKGGAK